MAQFVNEDYIIKAISAKIQLALEEEFQSQLVKFQDTIADRVRATLGQMAVELLSNYSLSRRGLDIIITVKNEMGE